MSFAAAIGGAYATEGAAIDLGRAVHEGELLAGRLAEPAPAGDARAPMEHVPLPRRRRAPAPRESSPDGVGDFLRSREGKALSRQVVRGIFGMLRKRL